MSWHPCRQIAKSQNAWFTVLSVIIGALCNRGHWFHHDITPSSSLAWIAIIISICSTLSIPVLHNPAYTEARMILLDSKSDHVTQTLKGLQHTFLPQFPRPSMVWPLTPSPTCPPFPLSLTHYTPASLVSMLVLLSTMYTQSVLSLCSPPEQFFLQRVGSRKWLFQLKQREWIAFSLLFPSIQTFKGLDDAQPHWWGWYLSSLLTQMLFSSGDTLTGK